jgi:hypothetical protein
VKVLLGVIVLIYAVAVIGPLVLGGNGGLLTDPWGGNWCYTSGAYGLLVADPVAGTALKWHYPGNPAQEAEDSDRPPQPVMWPHGYRARSAGSEVEVLNEAGEVVATTGHMYALEGGGRSDVNAFYACGKVIPED